MAEENKEFSVTTPVIPDGEFRDVQIRTNLEDFFWKLLEIDVDAAPADYDFSLFKSSPGVDLIYQVVDITLAPPDRLVRKPELAVRSASKTIFLRIANNSGGPRTFTITVNVGVRL